MTRRFVKKPLEIEAFRLGFEGIPGWMYGSEDIHFHHITLDEPYYYIIRTLEGTMRADEGDYIIKGIKGEIYPCKREIFEASYEEVPTCNHHWVDIQTNQPIASLGVNWVHSDGLAICVHCGVKK